MNDRLTFGFGAAFACLFAGCAPEGATQSVGSDGRPRASVPKDPADDPPGDALPRVTGVTGVTRIPGVTHLARLAGVARNRIDASDRTTCWLTDRGAIACNGQLLRGTSSEEDGAFVKVSVGGDIACGLREDGTVRCFMGWIACDHDEPCSVGGPFVAGPGGDLRRDLPGHYLDLDVESHGSAVLAVDIQYRARRFYVGPTGGFPTAEFALTGPGVETVRPNGIVDRDIEPTDFVRVAGNAFQLCGLEPSGHLICWETSNNSNRYEPEGTFVAIASGASHLCALSTEDRSVTCWGGDEAGQAANAHGPFTAVSAGDTGTCALLESGEAQCWGDGSPNPGLVPDGTFVAIASGGGHRCAMRESGDVECWGFGPGLPAADSSDDVEGPIRGAVDTGCTRLPAFTSDRFQCELERGYLSALGLVKVNAVEFTQLFGSEKKRNIWVSSDAASIYGAIDPDDPAARIDAPIPVGTRLVHENPGGDRYELMTKLPAGASPENGDWEFTRHLLDGTRTNLPGGNGYGPAPSPLTCLECHEMAERRGRTDLLWGVPRDAMR